MNKAILGSIYHPILVSKNKQSIICLFLLFVFILCPLAATAEESGFNIDLGRLFFSFSPKILEDGTQNDYSVGFFYNNALKTSGELRFRTINTSFFLDDDAIWDITDSMLSGSQEAYEVFLLPFNYHFFRTEYFSFSLGAGVYYNFNKTHEKGYLNDSTLYYPAGPDNYNLFKYDFSGHAIGPMADAVLNLRWGIFYGSFSAGIVPFFYFNQKQTLVLSPLMTPDSFTVSSGSLSGPYYYLNLDLAVSFNYFSLFVTLFNESSKLSYSAIGFGEAVEWASPDVTVNYITLALEVSVLINLGSSDLIPQIGYGRLFDTQGGGKNYFLVGVKKFQF